MSSWLPPGCTDDDIDRAAAGYDEPLGPFIYVARDGDGHVIPFEANNEGHAMDICYERGWIFDGRADEDDSD